MRNQQLKPLIATVTECEKGCISNFWNPVTKFENPQLSRAAQRFPVVRGMKNR